VYSKIKLYAIRLVHKMARPFFFEMSPEDVFPQIYFISKFEGPDYI
jgi:hypothetical protein